MGEITKIKCECCGFLTIDKDSITDICPLCFWQKDAYQEENIDDSGGPNLVSLREAKVNFNIIREGKATDGLEIMPI